MCQVVKNLKANLFVICRGKCACIFFTVGHLTSCFDTHLPTIFVQGAFISQTVQLSRGMLQ